MAPGRRKGSGRAAAAAAAAARQQWKVGDLVLAKMKGFPAWPAMVSEPEKWGYSSDRKKLLVFFYGTKQIAFCNYADVEAFTEEKKKSLLAKRQGKGADFVRAVDEIIDIYESLKNQKVAEVNSGDEGTRSSSGKLEVSRCQTLRKSPEISSDITPNHHSEALCASVKSSDVVNRDEISAAIPGAELHNRSTVTNGATEKGSILDQLRQTPLASTTTTRKRQREAPQPSFVIQKVPSLRRSRSAGGDPNNVQKSTVLVTGTDLASDCLVSDAVQEESTVEERPMGEVSHISVCGDGATAVSSALSCPKNLPCPNNSEDAVSEIPAVKSDATDLDVGTMLESCCKPERPENGYVDKYVGMNGDVRLNGKVDLPTKSMILKKKRKPNRKRVSNNRRCATLDMEVDLQVELHERLSESPNSPNEVKEMSSKADGDEHLPLVKRARVRMGKPSMKDTHVDEVVGTKERLEADQRINKCEKHPTSSSPVNSFPSHGPTLSMKEASSFSPMNDCTHSTGRDLTFWKINKYHLKGMDVEAALPPSKRLHRALEAMSANAAEAVDKSPDAPSNEKMLFNGCADFPMGSDIHHSADGNGGSPTKSLCIQPSDSTALHNSTSELSSTLTSQNLEVPTLTSEVQPDDTPIGHLRSTCDKDCKEVLMDVKECDSVFTSKIVDTNIQKTGLRSCSSKSAEKQLKSTSSEGVSGPSFQPLVEDNESLHQTSGYSYSRRDEPGGNGTKEPFLPKFNSCLNPKEGDSILSSNVAGTVQSVANIGSSPSNITGATRSSSPQSDKSIQARDIQDVAKTVTDRTTLKDRVIPSDLAPMKDLIAAAQAKRLLSRSTSFPDNVADGNLAPDAVESPSMVHREGFSVQGSPSNPRTYGRPTSDDRSHYLQNGTISPLASLRDKSFNKSAGRTEVNAARRSFEALLSTLSRTKESIGRATRVAMDCVKHGIAGEVIEVLLQNLEKEPSLYKRVDLFFLVDSITQCSRCQKGGAGDVYLSLVQSVLPRLLSAVAPPGNAAWENRRQCLKVLRLWIERKTLPESIIRHHIRELESINESSSSSAYPRRPHRTERALNDPVREMEGMLVDEYGSNTSFQLPHFLQPRLLEDEEGSDDDEKSFEAVTPERYPNVDDEEEQARTQTSTEKHRHILEDVDGELEMEDVAPPCGAEVSSACHSTGTNNLCNTHNEHEHHHSTSIAPPLPEDMPPSPPPLPSSPPPVALRCSSPVSLAARQQSAGSHSCTVAVDFHPPSVSQNIQSQVQLPISKQQNNVNGTFISSESVPIYSHVYGGLPKAMPQSLSSFSSSGSCGNLPGSHPAMHSGNNVQPIVSAPLPNKAYHLQPPPPTISNQFSYVQPEPQQRMHSWGGGSSYNDRFQYGHDTREGNFFRDRGMRGPLQHEIAERGRFSPAISAGPALPDKCETLHSSHSHFGPPWSHPPRTASYSLAAPRPLLENPSSRVNGASGYWRPR